MLDRRRALNKIKETPDWDMIVIGGGATGLGIAVDAAQRGYRVVLLEKGDFAKGTSSKSTKLVHGGVRYLAQGNLKLVVEALRERGLLLNNAPHLTKIQFFVIPVYSWFQLWFYGLGLSLYDLLAGKLSLKKTKILSRSATLDCLPGLRQQGLKGGIRYADGQFDDARLAVSLALTAADFGGVVVNYFSVTQLLKHHGKIVGVQARDELDGTLYHLRAQVVINATGVFADRILAMDQPNAAPVVMPSQGVHLVVPQSCFPAREALMIPKTKDGRVLFAVPWQNVVVMGTTDTYLDHIDEEPAALEQEIHFILDQFNRYRENPIDRSAIQSVFAGLRPLVFTAGTANTAKASRDHTILQSDSGLLSVIGGKWTTYRKMAQDVVDMAAQKFGLPAVKCQTKHLKLHDTSKNSLLEQLITANPHLTQRIHPDYPYTEAEVVWAVRHEMALQIEDILARRSRLLVINAHAAITVAPRVAALMAKELGNDQQWEQQQVEAFRQLAKTWLAA